MAGETDEAQHSAEWAVTILQPTGNGAALAHASVYEGAILAITDEPQRADTILTSARELAIRADRLDLAALSLNYLGIARVELGDPDGLQLLRHSIMAAVDAHQYEYAARGYCNLAEMLCRSGDLDELERACTTGFASPANAVSGRTPTASSCTAAWPRPPRPLGAGAGRPASLVEGVDDPGMLYAYSVPWLGRLLARLDDETAPETCSPPHGSTPAASAC